MPRRTVHSIEGPLHLVRNELTVLLNAQPEAHADIHFTTTQEEHSDFGPPHTTTVHAVLVILTHPDRPTRPDPTFGGAIAPDMKGFPEH